MIWDLEKWDRYNLPERPEGCFAQIVPVPNGINICVSHLVFSSFFSCRRGLFMSGYSLGRRLRTRGSMRLGR